MRKCGVAEGRLVGLFARCLQPGCKHGGPSSVHGWRILQHAADLLDQRLQALGGGGVLHLLRRELVIVAEVCVTAADCSLVAAAALLAAARSSPPTSPKTAAADRSLVITILRLAGAASIAAALRYHARRPSRPLQTIMKC